MSDDAKAADPHHPTAQSSASKTYDVVDAFAGNELYQDNGWTDGLPIVPPTEELVRAFLDAAHLGSEDVIAVEPVRRHRITAEKVAIAAVMAGRSTCRSSSRSCGRCARPSSGCTVPRRRPEAAPSSWS